MNAPVVLTIVALTVRLPCCRIPRFAIFTLRVARICTWPVRHVIRRRPRREGKCPSRPYLALEQLFASCYLALVSLPCMYCIERFRTIVSFRVLLRTTRSRNLVLREKKIQLSEVVLTRP